MKKNSIFEDFKNKFSKLRKNIKKIKDMNTVLFGNLSNDIVKMYSDMQDFQKTIEESTDYFLMKESSEKDSLNVFSLMDTFNKFITLNQENETKSKIFFEKLNNEMKNVVNVTELFDKLNNIANDMHLLSLNAFISSHKLGDTGKALMEITNEITNVSQQITKLVNKIEELTLEIMKFSNDVNFIINKIADINEEMVEKSSEHSQSIGDSLRDISNYFNEVFSEIDRKISEINQVQSEYINKIQLEDVLRQKIEHSEKVCEKVIEIISNSSEQYSDNDIYNLLEEAVNILNNIIYDSFNKYRDFIFESKNVVSNIKEITEDISKTNNHLSNYKKNDEIESLSSLVEYYNNWYEFIQKRFHVVDKGKSKIIEDWHNNTDYFDDIDSNISSFNNIKKRLNLLGVLSNIQIQKKDIFSDDYKFTEKLKEISKIVDKSMKGGFRKLSINVGKMKKIMNEYQNSGYGNEMSFKKLANNFEKINEKLLQKENALSQKSEEFTNHIQDYKLKLDNFAKIINQNDQELSNLENTFGNFIQEMKNELEDIRKESKIAINDEINNKFLEETVNNFNLQLDKMRAYQDNTKKVEKTEDEEEPLEDDNLTLF